MGPRSVRLIERYTDGKTFGTALKIKENMRFALNDRKRLIDGLYAEMYNIRYKKEPKWNELSWIRM